MPMPAGQISPETELNGQLVLQYAPIDTITATLDYTFSQVDTEKDANGFGIWFDGGDAVSSLTINERGTWTELHGVRT